MQQQIHMGSNEASCGVQGTMECRQVITNTMALTILITACDTSIGRNSPRSMPRCRIRPSSSRPGCTTEVW
jgi:hypothetical protein